MNALDFAVREIRIHTVEVSRSDQPWHSLVCSALFESIGKGYGGETLG